MRIRPRPASKGRRDGRWQPVGLGFWHAAQSISTLWRNRQCSGLAGFEECTAGEGEVTCQPALIAACVVIAATVLGGCSDAPAIRAHENTAAPTVTGRPAAAHTANASLREHFASAALDDRGL